MNEIKFRALYGTRRFRTAFTRVRHLSLFWAMSIHSMLLQPTSWGSILVLSSHLLLGFQVDSFPQPLLFPILATCPAHLILLDLIIRILFGEECRSLSSSLCSFLHSPTTPSLLGPNIFRSALFSYTLSYVSPSVWATKFQTHTNNRLKLLCFSLSYVHFRQYISIISISQKLVCTI
jgi:hypothetical protein